MASDFKPLMDGGYPMECENCGSIAPLDWFEQGPPTRGRKALCEYCASVIDKESKVAQQMAQMFNVLERRLSESLPKDSSQ